MKREEYINRGKRIVREERIIIRRKLIIIREERIIVRGERIIAGRERSTRGVREELEKEERLLYANTRADPPDPKCRQAL